MSISSTTDASSPQQGIHTAHIRELRNILGQGFVIDDDSRKFTQDWTKSYSGGRTVCFPGSTDEVSAVLKYCHQHCIPVVPQGGNTGLVGGSVACSDRELIISLSRMNRIIQIDADAQVMFCEAGCILEHASSAAASKDLVVPLDLGSKGSCMIGGNVSTNAGGLRLIKYGSMHSNILGLEVVLADGSVVDGLRGLRKDNCGYQLGHLFIGAEGTLGIVTKVAMALHAKPAHVSVVLAKVSIHLYIQYESDIPL